MNKELLRRSKTFWFFILILGISFYVGRRVPPTWTVEKIAIDVEFDENNAPFYIYKGKRKYIKEIIPYERALLPEMVDAEEDTADKPLRCGKGKGKDEKKEEFVFLDEEIEGEIQRVYYQLHAKSHFKFWSLLPALAAVMLCWLTREPVTALLGGVIVGAALLGKYDLTSDVLVSSLMTKSSATVLVLYLWFLGGLMGVWSKTGAAKAFAEFMTKRFVRGPKTAKLAAWMLGVIFFQGGTISTVLVGTTVKPIADKENISHEELAYIVDSTASPIASQLAFNAWPGYVQAFIFVAGVSWLATETQRITFFFKSVPFCFYAIFAVMLTFLLSIDRAPFLGKKLREAIARARKTGKLDAPDAQPLSARELQESHVPRGYKPHVIEFIAPLLTLIGIAIGTFIFKGSPEVLWAFAAALVVAMSLALIKGMSLNDLMTGFGEGLKGVVLGSVILLLAITIGGISKEAGGGIYLVELLGTRIPYWALPVMLQVLTIIIAFSTGTSWGTYAVAFPLAMPLAWAVANANGLAHPEFFMTICFAAVMDGSVYGDQCSPISDTTVLSSMCTGCDLMDHVKTQIPQATVAAILAAICWTAVTFIFA
ncbi:Na+/H+ antiporter NhaC family protein [Elusimicrobiota bacterium]